MSSLVHTSGNQSSRLSVDDAVVTSGATKQSSPEIEYKQEVRFAVVMYGGVSLAIYINGIAQELLRWARSTAQDSTGKVALIATNDSTDQIILRTRRR